MPPLWAPGPLAGQVGEVLSLAEGARVLPSFSLGRGRPLQGWGWATPISETLELRMPLPPTPGGPGLLQEEKGLGWGNVEPVSLRRPVPTPA